MTTGISVQPDEPYQPSPEIDFEAGLKCASSSEGLTDGGPRELEGSHASGVRTESKDRKPLRCEKSDNRDASSLRRHESHCTICKHPQRDAIDQAFLHWERPSAIADEFHLPDRAMIYRHAHALGLFRQRAAKSRHALQFIVEQADGVKATADSIIRAVRALSCLTEDGRWIEPVKRTIITHEFIDHTDGRVPKQIEQLHALNPVKHLERLPNQVARRVAEQKPAQNEKSGSPRPVNAAPTSQHTLRDNFAVTPAPSTKPPKLLNTLFYPFRGGVLGRSPARHAG